MSIGGKCLVGKCLVGKCPVGKCSVGKLQVGECPVGKCSVGKLQVGECTVGKCSLGELIYHKHFLVGLLSGFSSLFLVTSLCSEAYNLLHRHKDRLRYVPLKQ